MASIKCTKYGREHTHASVVAVKICQRIDFAPAVPTADQWHDGQQAMERGADELERIVRRMEDEATADAERAAERATERYFEEGPHGPEDDPRERALWALEDERKSIGTGIHQAMEEHWEQLEREAGGAPPFALQDAPIGDPETDCGYYERNGEVYKVQRNQAQTHIYAKRLTNKAQAGTGAKPQWDYAKGAVKDLRRSHRLNGVRAGELGKLFNWCISCSKELSREESIDRGYGPDCATNHGWPYDHSRKG